MRRASGTPRVRMPTQRQFVDAAVAFEDFVRDAREAAGHPVRIEDNWHRHLFAASQGRVKERKWSYSVGTRCADSGTVHDPPDAFDAGPIDRKSG